MYRRYVSWVPTVTGRLSFSEIGAANSGGTQRFVNIADDNSFGPRSMDRYVIAYQHRDLEDRIRIPFVTRALDWLRQTQARPWFLLIAQATNDPGAKVAPMNGRVFVFSEIKGWAEKSKEKESPSFQVREAMERLNAFNADQQSEPDGSDGVESLTNYFDGEYKKLKEGLEGQSFFFIDFQLQRNGELVLVLDNDVCKKIGGVGRETYLDDEKRPIEKYDLSARYFEQSAQCFMFIRDLAHRHQHHATRSDLVIDLQELPPVITKHEKEEVEKETDTELAWHKSVETLRVSDDPFEVELKDDVDWRAFVLQSLYRKLQRFKKKTNRDHLEVFAACRGTMVYAQSFQRISLESLENQHRIILCDECDEALKREGIVKGEDATKEARYNSRKDEIERSHAKRLDNERSNRFGLTPIIFDDLTLGLMDSLQAKHELKSKTRLEITQIMLVVFFGMISLFVAVTGFTRLVVTESQVKRNLSVTFEEWFFFPLKLTVDYPVLALALMILVARFVATILHPETIALRRGYVRLVQGLDKLFAGAVGVLWGVALGWMALKLSQLEFETVIQALEGVLR